MQLKNKLSGTRKWIGTGGEFHQSSLGHSLIGASRAVRRFHISRDTVSVANILPLNLC